MTHSYVQNVIDVGLMACTSSDFAINFINEYGQKLRDDSYSNCANEELERALLERDEADINIALASNATNMDVLAALFLKSKLTPANHAQRRYLKSLRLAVLSNDVCPLSRHWFTRFPEPVLSKEDLTQLIEAGDDDEICALFDNAMIDPELLHSLYGGRGHFESIGWERKRVVVNATASNKRLVTKFESGYGGDSDFSGIHIALFELLSTAPVEFHWMVALDGLIGSLNPFNLPAPNKSVLPILERWKAVDDDSDGLFRNGLKWKDEFRCLIAALYGAHHDGSPTSEDVAVRCAFYGKGKLDESSMSTGYQKDAAVYVFAAMNNREMLLDVNLRSLFETEHFSRQDFPGPLFHRYSKLCHQLHATNPYPYFDPRPLPERLADAKKKDQDAATKKNAAQNVAAIEKLSGQLEQIEKKNGELEKIVARLKTILIWAVLVLGGLILART